MKGLLTYVLAATPIAVLLFLGLSGFFSRWNGVAVSVRPPAHPEPPVYLVLIVDDEGHYWEQTWKADVVEPLGLPFDTIGVPPPTFEDKPETRKYRYTLEFEVRQPGEDWSSHPTTTPQALAVSVIFWFVGLALRNMYYAGTPFSFRPRERFHLEQQEASGTVKGPRARRSQQGPPPQSGRRRGRGRRR